jgi:hypothetical protein
MSVCMHSEWCGTVTLAGEGLVGPFGGRALYSPHVCAILPMFGRVLLSERCYIWSLVKH